MWMRNVLFPGARIDDHFDGLFADMNTRLAGGRSAACAGRWAPPTARYSDRRSTAQAQRRCPTIACHFVTRATDAITPFPAQRGDQDRWGKVSG